LTGYTFVSLASVGDQPGQHTSRYLAPWQNLPEGTFIAQQKFQPRSQYYVNNGFTIYGFSTNSVPFPFETNSTYVSLPCIAFNYLGQLTTNGADPSYMDEYIPLARGSVSPAIDPATKALVLSGPPQASEDPPGNSTNSAYNIVHIESLTGRATLEYQKVQ
jgi:hypothetical protein